MPEHIFIQIRKLGSLISGPFVDQMGLNNKGKGRVSTLVHKSFEDKCSWVTFFLGSVSQRQVKQHEYHCHGDGRHDDSYDILIN